MDTSLSPVETLKPAFERLRAAHLGKIPDYDARMAALDRLGQAVRRYKDEIIAACSADFGRRAPLETLGADVMVSLDEIKHARRHLRGWMRPQRRAVNLSFLPARGEVRYAPAGSSGLPSVVAAASSGAGGDARA